MLSTAPDTLYIDVRPYDKTDGLSYDLSQHLPRRLGVGNVLIIADNPPVFLSVIRKRIAKLQHDLERERARTLDRQKRLGLNREMLRLSTARFTTKPRALVPGPDVLCTAPYTLTHQAAQYTTVYIAVALSSEQLGTALGLLAPGGLLVVYGEWPRQYQEVLAEHRVV